MRLVFVPRWASSAGVRDWSYYCMKSDPLEAL